MQRRRYELLVVDLDGTLLRRDGTISSENCRAVDEARQAGMQVLVATGRALSESRSALAAIRHQGLVVAAGGSLLCDAASGRTVDRRVLDEDVVTQITGSLVEAGHKVLILKDAHVTGYDYLAVGDGEFDPASTWWFNSLGIEVRHIEHLSQDSHPRDTVRTAAVGCQSKLSPVASRLRQSVGHRCCLQHWPAVTGSHAIGSSTHLLEIFTSNVNKWTMVQSLCESEGIDPKRVAAIGDGLNDVELVESAGLGIAMGNSIPRVLEAAKQVTADQDQDGVALAVRRILTGEW